MTESKHTKQAAILYLDTKPAWFRYSITLTAIAAAALMTIHLPVIGEHAVFLLFLLAIIQSTFWLGLDSGLLSVALSLLAVNLLMLSPARIEYHNLIIINAEFCILSGLLVFGTRYIQCLLAKLSECRQDLDYTQAIGHIGTWRLNMQNNELRWSDETHRIFGIPKGTPMTYESFLSYVHPDDREYVDHSWQAALRGKTYDITHRLLVAGRLRWVRERAVLEFNNNGQLRTGFGTVQDITELTTSEQALEESKRRVAGIVESAMDAIVIINDNLHIVLFNNAAEKMFGYSKEDVLGEAIELIIPEWFHRGQGQPISIFKTHSAEPLKKDETIITGLRSNGVEFPIEASLSELEIEGGKSFTAILRDITERMRIEFALQERLKLQDQIAKVAETAPGLICSFRLHPDNSACMPYASPVIESIYGFKPKDVNTDFSPVFARIHPDDISHVHESIAESARTMQPWQDTYRYNHPSKGYVWHEGHSMPLRELDGSMLWHGYIQDVTERKRAETVLRDQETELRLIMDATPALISYLNTDLRYLRVNATYIQWFGLTKAQILGQKARDIVGEKSWEIIAPFLEKALAGEQVDFDQLIPYGNNAPRWVHATYIPHKDADGHVKGIVVHAADIEARKQYEQEIAVLNKNLQHRLDELRSSQTRLSLIIEEVKAGYWDWDLITRSLYLSPEWKRQIGFDDHEVLNRWEEWEGQLHPEDRPFVWSTTENFIAGRQQVYELEYRIRHKDGSYRWIHSRGSLLRDANNQPYRLLGINLDITDYMKTKALGERREKMEKAFRLYVAGQTAAAIAHELNQPLTAISSYADVALQLLETGKGDPQKLHHVIENCSIQAQRAGQVMRQLLTLLHKGETLVEPINLNIAIHDALDLIQTDLNLYGFSIALSLDGDLPQVVANGMQIQKVLLNLLHNSLEAMQENKLKSGTITIKTHIAPNAPSMAQVSVCDCGKGVTAGALKSIFQAFYTTKSTGLGMGLAISHALIEAHGGEMWAEQNGHHGLIVHFTLPFES